MTIPEVSLESEDEEGTAGLLLLPLAELSGPYINGDL